MVQEDVAQTRADARDVSIVLYGRYQLVGVSGKMRAVRVPATVGIELVLHLAGKCSGHEISLLLVSSRVTLVRC